MSSSGLAQASTLVAVALPDRPGTWDLTLRDGVVAEVTSATTAPSGMLALPAFHDPHTHADRAFAPIPRPPQSLEDAIMMANELRETSTSEQVQIRASRLFCRAITHGAVRVRTHVDHSPMDNGDRDRRAVRAAADAVSKALEVEIVAFATTELDPLAPSACRALSRALDDGANVLGAFVTLNDDPEASLDALLDLAASTGAEVDVHLDEHGDAGASLLDHLARATISRGLEGRVTAGHCCALATLDPVDAIEVAKRVREADITIISLPALNLFLQDRGAGTPRRRGVTLVRELLDCGVKVRFGSDNVRDPFYPYGDADPLEAAWLASVAAQVDDTGALLEGICGGKRSISVGDSEPIVLAPAASFTEALARRPAGRRVVHPTETRL